jgi:hypothetical protein
MTRKRPNPVPQWIQADSLTITTPARRVSIAAGVRDWQRLLVPRK